MNLADATDLELWAERRDAQAQLPQLVRRLIAASADGLTRLSVRAGEGVVIPGWDGVAEAERESVFVPAGLSVWEMGVGEPQAKANGDYRKRTTDPDGVVPAETTFVFVTPRRWRDKEEWAARKSGEGVWKAVVAYDADDLETVLESAPHVHVWISALLGKDTYDAEGLDSWWEAWSGATEPSLPQDLLVSGRQGETKALLDILRGAPGTTSVAADSADEALAFVATSSLSTGNQALVERSLVVRTPQAWQRLAVSPTPMILLSTFDRPAVTVALSHGHHVVIPLGREATTARGIELPRLRRAGIEAALVGAGLPRERASALATMGRRSLLSLRRTLAANPDAMVPAWASPEYAPDIVPAVLAGSWNDSLEGDREAIAAIAGRPYDEVARTLTRWLQASDPPVRRVGTVWMVAAKSDTWPLVARALTTGDLDRFRQVALDVLGAEDPALELPPDRRMMAGVLGRQRRHSGALIKGVADTLAVMATTSSDVVLPGGRTGETEASVVIRRLLDTANEDPTGRQWESVAGVLPLLAEASPTAVLRAIEAGSRTVEGPVLQLFQDGDDHNFLSPGSPHPSLLWALETLAWAPEHLPHAARLLAVLHRLEPGGRTLNRPFSSLCSILLLWRPGTSAPLDVRVQVVDLLRRQVPDVAWPLMLRLIPGGDESASSTSSPDHRDWKPEETDGVPTAELFRAIEAVVDRAVEDAGTDGARWTELVGRAASAGGFTPHRVIGALESLDLNGLAGDGRGALYRALLDLVHRHRQFSGAEWAMPSDTVDRIEALASALEPEDPIVKHGWLFEQRALDAFDDDDRRERRRSLGEAQDEALGEIVGAIGLDGLPAWAGTLANPSFSALQIGEALARSAPDPGTVLPWLTSEDEAGRRVAVQYVSRMARQHGLGWATDALRLHGSGWPPEQQVLFLSALDASPEVWAVVEGQGADVNRLYWANAHPWSLPTEGDDARVAAENLTAAGQPRAALHLLGMAAHRPDFEMPMDALVQALEEAIRNVKTPFDHEVARDIGDHLDRLDEAGFDEDRLARLEWAYLPLFRYEKRRSRVLHRRLAESPEFFVEAVSLAYKARGEDPPDLDEAGQAAAMLAHDLLNSWRTVPGTQTDGTIDGGALNAWFAEVRGRLVDVNRVEGGEHAIGRVLRYGPPALASHPHDPDGDGVPNEAWPADPIRDLIEDAASDDLEQAFEIEVHNSRGVTSRGMTDGGGQERALAERYRRHAAVAGVLWPRTAALLVRIAESYEREASRHDLDADLTEDTWT